MAEKLKLKTTGSKTRVRFHIITLTVVIVACLALGFAAGKYGIPGITNNVADNNCMSETDFKYFLEDANVVRAEYQKCVSDLWSLQLAYKMNSAKEKIAANLTNSTS